jgi:hypothetical protein
MTTIKFDDETSRAARNAFVTTIRTVNLHLEPHQWADWRAAVQVFTDSANAQVEQTLQAPSKDILPFEPGKWYRSKGMGYAYVQERNIQTGGGRLEGHLILHYKSGVGPARATLDGRVLGIMAETYHLKRGEVDVERIRLEDQVASSEQLLKAAKQEVSGAGLRADRAEAALREVRQQRDEGVEEVKSSADRAVAVERDRKDAVELRKYWQGRATCAEAERDALKTWRNNLLESLAQKVQRILRAGGTDRQVGMKITAMDVATIAGLHVQEEIVTPVSVTWSIPETPTK